MSGEQNIQDSDNSELKKPLQKDDLMGPSVQAVDPVYEEAKERYRKQLEAILAEMPMKFGVPVLNILNAAAKAEENTDAED